MIIRLLALIGIVFLLVKGVRLWLAAVQAGQRITRAGGEPSQIDDVMVKDPYCNVYFPKRDGIHLRFKGEDFYFCSETCRDKFLAERR
jgi:YHS domain-containing protein